MLENARDISGMEIILFKTEKAGDKDKIKSAVSSLEAIDNGKYLQYPIEQSFCDCIPMKDNLEPSNYTRKC